MDYRDREKITRNCHILVNKIDWPEIWPKLFEHKIYQEEDQNVEQWGENLNNIDTKREIYLHIRQRGPRAFENFVRCLREIGRNDLADILNSTSSHDQIDNDRTNILNHKVNGNNNIRRNDETFDQEVPEEDDDYYKRFHETKKPLKVCVTKSTSFTEAGSDGIPCYPMRSNPHGLVLIINNIEFGEASRTAAEYDEANLKELFEQMGFKVEISRNKTKQEMLDKFEAFSKKPKLRRVHSMFVIVMSHGNEHGNGYHSQSVIYGIDRETMTDTEVLNFFTAEACENMYNKPKVFIFQACRGNMAQQTVKTNSVAMGRNDTDGFVCVPATEDPEPLSTRKYSDMLIAYSTLRGHESHRDIHNGCWYIQILCEVFMNHAHNKELFSMFQMIDQRLSTIQMSEKCQTSEIWNRGFNKKCYLNPGYFGNGTDN